MAALSGYAAAELRKHFFRTGSFTKPTVMAIALFTAPGVEVAGGSYARVDLPPLDANWSAVGATDGATDNLAAIVFPAPTANWGTITDVGIYDATTAGNLLASGTLTVSKTIMSGDPAPQFPIGDLDVIFS